MSSGQQSSPLDQDGQGDHRSAKMGQGAQHMLSLSKLFPNEIPHLMQGDDLKSGHVLLVICSVHHNLE